MQPKLSNQAANLVRHRKRKAPVVLAVCSGKGGVGKTNVATNVAVAMAGHDAKVMLLDADLSLANVDVLLGLQPKFTLAHLVAGEVDLESTILTATNGLRVVPASSGNFSMIDLSPAEQSIIVNSFAAIAEQPDFLVVDTAPGLTGSVLQFAQAAQEVLVVICDEPASLTDGYALVKILSRHHGVSRFRVVTNMTASRFAADLLFDKFRRVADRYLDIVLSHEGDIPADAGIRRAIQAQKPIVQFQPGSRAARAIDAMARKLVRIPPANRLPGGIQFFWENMFWAANTARESQG